MLSIISEFVSECGARPGRHLILQERWTILKNKLFLMRFDFGRQIHTVAGSIGITVLGFLSELSHDRLMKPRCTIQEAGMVFPILFSYLVSRFCELDRETVLNCCLYKEAWSE